MVVLTLAALVLMSGCGLVRGAAVGTRALLGGNLRVQVRIAQDANQQNPVAMDLLLVYDKQLLKQLLKMSARDWYSKRRQVRRDYPRGTGFDVWEWEWVPGQSVPEQSLPLKAKARAAIIFAHYLVPGEHRARIKPRQSITITLGKTAFTVQPLR